jgi:putative flippase GtrA
MARLVSVAWRTPVSSFAMHQPVVALRAFLGTATGQKLQRYFVASVVNVLAAEAVVVIAFGLLHWSATRTAVLAAVVAAIPAYWLARRWVWGRTGRSHLRHEVLPFWGLALLGLALNTWVAGVAERVGAEVTASRSLQTLILMGAGLGVSGAFWVARFLLLNGVLFADRRPWQARPELAPLADLPLQVAEVSPGAH